MDNQLKDSDSGVYTIAANDQENFEYAGRFVRCLSSTGEVELSFNNGSRVFLQGGIQYSVDDTGADFSSFQVSNKSDVDVTINLVWGFGNVDDSRLSLEGDITIVNGGTDFEVNDGGTQGEIRTFRRILTEVTSLSGESFKKGKTPLDGASYATASAATNVLVTAADNTDGVVVRVVSGSIHSIGDYATMLIDGNPIVSTGSASSHHHHVLTDILIPAGVEVSLFSNNAAYLAAAWYEVL